MILYFINILFLLMIDITIVWYETELMGTVKKIRCSPFHTHSIVTDFGDDK